MAMQATLPPRPASPERLRADLIRLIAPNPSPMTYWGTNTYLLGRSEIAVIDPGPADSDHIDAILHALPKGAKITHIFVTHAHLDHSPGAALLQQQTDAPILAYGRASAGRSAVMTALAEVGLTGGGEGVDDAFVCDVSLPDGAEVESADWHITAHWTPGHMSNHMSYATPDALFCGDHVMDWSSSLISPPDGDLRAFLNSNEKLLALDERSFYPGHGLPIERPHDRLHWLTKHRAQREAQLLQVMTGDGQSLTDLTKAVYIDIDQRMLPAAERNLFAHLIDLHERGAVRATPVLGLDALFSIP